jgi:hypothetical protein
MGGPVLEARRGCDGRSGDTRLVGSEALVLEAKGV